ncbi:unnamed protein product [Fraxinus pennsylvanica]|uniref:ABC transporter domain-containing protein n=1 Tax=Fraxinus pennsylvanica TaxID=56036 RepID=A0AAD1YVS0_9LAMI|nr:unnamed protein product [Fraxinus pennsylvanica]
MSTKTGTTFALSFSPFHLHYNLTLTLIFTWQWFTSGSPDKLPSAQSHTQAAQGRESPRYAKYRNINCSEIYDTYGRLFGDTGDSTKYALSPTKLLQHGFDLGTDSDREYGEDIHNGSSTQSNLTASLSEDSISFSKVDIITPAQEMLAKQLTCVIAPGRSLLVTGPNGSGKSSIFRVLRGLWPVVSGILVKPHQQINSGSGCGLFYVPQRPYTCLGTPRDQIIYPLSLDEAEKRALGHKSVGVTDSLDAHLKTILENVKLLYLLEREGGWDANQNWEDILSLGEKQRLGMARLFFHKPQFGILDKCTNATSVDVEEHLYSLANNSGITVITSSQFLVLPRSDDYGHEEAYCLIVSFTITFNSFL